MSKQTFTFLVHLSRSRRLKCTIVIMHYPSYVRRQLFTFSTSPLKPLNRIQRNLTGSKNSKSSTKFVFFGPIGKTRWPPWPLIGWDIFDFFSKTTEWNSTKLERKQDLNVLYQVCVFRADRKNKLDALAVDWLTHFRLLLWNRWKKFNETWQEAWSQHPLPSLCFSGRSEKQVGRPGFGLGETFSTSPLKPLNRIQGNVTGSKISTSSTKFVFFEPIGKTRWPPWPLIGWDIFDFSSETTEQNSSKRDRKQDLNVFYQVCVFRANRKNKMAALASDWLIPLRLLLWNRWTEMQRTWQEARSLRPIPSLCFSGRLVNKNVRLSRFLIKVAYCSHVHDMWPFGPIVTYFHRFANTLHFMKNNPVVKRFFLDKYRCFFNMKRPHRVVVPFLMLPDILLRYVIWLFNFRGTILENTLWENRLDYRKPKNTPCCIYHTSFGITQCFRRWVFYKSLIYMTTNTIVYLL